MSLLSDYEQRTAWKYEPVRGVFHTHEGLVRKVRTDGSFAPFAGSTVVFRPGKRCQQIVPLIQRVIREKLDDPDMLAAPLPASTVHMTLHDLVSPEMCFSNPEDARQYAREADVSLKRAAGIAEEIRKVFAGRRIVMAADRIVPMVSKALVLLLKPAGEADYELLLDLYRRFDEVMQLPYPLTPHITLDYFRPGVIDGDRLGEALEFSQIRAENAPVFDFYPEGLTAQKFSDMQTYHDLPARVCFVCDGGLNRSVMAAHILNHLAKKRDLPIFAEARSASENTHGTTIPEEVRNTLERHEIVSIPEGRKARYLAEEEYSHFTAFAALSDGAVRRLSWMRVPEKRVSRISSFFYGVRDPQYGEVSHEETFGELYARVNRYLDYFEKEF